MIITFIVPAPRDIECAPLRNYVEKSITSDGDLDENRLTALLLQSRDIEEVVTYRYEAIGMLIAYSRSSQTPEMLEYYKALRPDAGHVAWLIQQCEYCQTPEMVEFLMALDPQYDIVGNLIANCEYCRTPEMIKLWLNMSSSNYILAHVVAHKSLQCKQVLEHITQLSDLHPSMLEWAIAHSEAFQTVQMRELMAEIAK
jgi:hypothetical protein